MLTQQADNVYQLGNPELSEQNFGRVPIRVKQFYRRSTLGRLFYFSENILKKVKKDQTKPLTFTD